MSYYLFLVTVPSIDLGKKIASALVESKLAACVNIVQNIFSIYEWKGNVEESSEHLLLIKTMEDKCDALIKKVVELHSYDTPECIGFKIEKGSQKYLKWLQEAVGK